MKRIKRKCIPVIASLALLTTAASAEANFGLDLSSASNDTLAVGVGATYTLESSFIQSARIAGGGLYVKKIGNIGDKYKGYYIDTAVYGELLPSLHWQANYTYVGGTLDKLDKGYYKGVGTVSFDYKAFDVVDVIAGINTEDSYFVSLSKNIFKNSNIFAGWSHNYDTGENRGFVGITIALHPIAKTAANPISATNVIANLNSKIREDVIKHHHPQYEEQPSHQPSKPSQENQKPPSTEKPSTPPSQSQENQKPSQPSPQPPSTEKPSQPSSQETQKPSTEKPSTSPSTFPEVPEVGGNSSHPSEYPSGGSEYPSNTEYPSNSEHYY